MKIQKIMLMNLFIFMNIFMNAEVVKVFDFDQLPQESTKDWIYEVKTVNNLPAELLAWYDVPVRKEIIDKNGNYHYVTEMESRSYVPDKYSKYSNLTGVVYTGQAGYLFYEGVTLKRISRNYKATRDEADNALLCVTITYTVETWNTANAPMNKYVETGLAVGKVGLVAGCTMIALGGCLYAAGIFK